MFASSKSEGKVTSFYKWDKKKDKLGEGAFAVVYRSSRTAKRTFKQTEDPDDPKLWTGEVPDQVAIKVIDKKKVEDMNDIKREVEIMRSARHVNIIGLYELFTDKKFMYLVSELVNGGELFDRIVERGNYTEKDAANCTYQICAGLAYLHAKDIVHRDLKPENLLYAKPDPDELIKIADFGLARTISPGELAKTACGTPGYVAPEILANKGYGDAKVDMWSIGVIFYVLLCGFPPFYEEELPALFDSILKAKYDFPAPYWDGVSDTAKQLVNELLELDIAKRLSAADVMKHPFMSDEASKNHSLAGAQGELKKSRQKERLKRAITIVKTTTAATGGTEAKSRACVIS